MQLSRRRASNSTLHERCQQRPVARGQAKPCLQLSAARLARWRAAAMAAPRGATRESLFGRRVSRRLAWRVLLVPCMAGVSWRAQLNLRSAPANPTSQQLSGIKATCVARFASVHRSDSGSCSPPRRLQLPAGVPTVDDGNASRRRRELAPVAILSPGGAAAPIRRRGHPPIDSQTTQATQATRATKRRPFFASPRGRSRGAARDCIH